MTDSNRIDRTAFSSEGRKPVQRHLELLAPGGSFDSVKAAFMAGADAVYMGGDRFSARAYAESAEEHSLEKAVDYAHLHDRKLYLTLNTLLKPEEMEHALYDYVLPLYEQGLDGILVQDLGVLRLVRREFPDLPVHASTQMTVTDAAGARLLQDLGVQRVVASRELNLRELRKIYDETGMELEAFVHGAICYCYSGRCLYSSLIGGRSGNRGRCAQPCRLPYELKGADGKYLNKKQENYLLSLKDMCTLSFLPQMAEAGVMSFKIEGRMKSPLYTAGIVSIYRSYLDRYLQEGGENWQVEERDVQAVSEFFDRGGFTEYLTRHNGREMMALKEKPKLRKPDRQLMADTENKYLNQELKEPVKGSVNICEGRYAVISLYTDRVKAETRSAEPVQESVNRPLTEADIRKQMNKLGNTPFALEQLQIELSEHAFLPVKALNEQRRETCAKLEEAILLSYRRNHASGEKDVPETSAHSGENILDSAATQHSVKLHVSVSHPRFLDSVLSDPGVDLVEMEAGAVNLADIPDLVKRCHAAGKTLFVKLPEIYRGKAIEDVKKLAQSEADGLTAANLEEIYALGNSGYQKPVMCAQSVYLWNREAKAGLREIAREYDLRLENTTASYELNRQELKELGIDDMRLLVYGHMPMMITANCLRKTENLCKKDQGRQNVKEPLVLIDRKHAQMPVVCNCRYCYNTIYNALPTYLPDQEDLIKKLRPGALYVSLTVENRKEAEGVIRACSGLKSRLNGDIPADGPAVIPVEQYTRGHFTRGVL